MFTVLYVLGTLVLVAVAAIGLLTFRAGRQLDGSSPVGSRRRPPAPPSTASSRGVADLVDGSVRRARVAVAELISTDVHHDDLRPSSAEFSRRGHTYTVLGIGLVGLAAVLLLGLVLVL